MSERKSRPLRFGIMCTGTDFSAWEASCIRQLIERDEAYPALLIVDSRISSLLATVRRVGMNKIMGVIHRRVIASPKAMKAVDLTTDLGSLPRIKCEVRRQGRFSEYFEDSDIDKIREYGLDFVLRFGFNIIRGEILRVPTYGVWSFHHGDEERYRGAPPAFWEIYNGDPVTGSILQRLSDTLDSGVVLKKAYFPTVNYSYSASLNRVLNDSASWPAQVCSDIRSGDAEYLNDPPSTTSAPIYFNPTNWQLIVFLLVTWKNLLLRMYQLFFRHEEWNIGIVDAPISFFVNSDTLPEISWLTRRDSNRFVADPFGFVDGEKNVILCEEFDYRSYRGFISQFAGRNADSTVCTNRVLDESYHLSYPYLIHDENDVYCIPEMSETRQVKLFRATESRSEWDEVTTLLSDFAAVDSTIVNFDGRWWLFCTCAENGRNDSLYLWHSETLTGPWEAHTRNPVKIDIRSARPGGTPFVYNGELYRPSQDCSLTYGGRVSLTGLRN